MWLLVIITCTHFECDRMEFKSAHDTLESCDQAIDKLKLLPPRQVAMCWNQPGLEDT